ncbi:MAG: hypothetical protein ACE5JK_04005 [Candidatus Omnitrophota bacterium]
MNSFSRLLFIVAVIAFSLYFFTDNKVDPDLWGHLEFGEDIYKNLNVPLYDTYSYSSAGARWVNHEWLSELVFYTIFKFAGGAGLLALKFCVGLIIALLIYLSVSKNTESVFLKIFFIILPLSVIGYGFATRPQIFTYLFFTLTIFLIGRFEKTRQRKWLYPFPLIFLSWSNLHGGFIAGIGVLLIYCLVKVLEKSATKSLIVITVSSIAATFINPNGPGVWAFLFKTLTLSRPYLPEWGRVTFSSYFVDYFAISIITLVGLVFSRLKRNAFETVLLVIGLFVSFLHNRHIVLFAVLFSMYMPKYVDSFTGRLFVGLERKLSERFLRIFVLALSLVFFLGAAFQGKRAPFRIEVPEDKYPVGAVKFIKDNRIEGNIFCFFDWAQMCIRELPGTNKVFFDGRYRTVYDEDLIEGYFEVLYGEREYKDFLRAFPETDIMLLHPSNQLAVKLSEDPEWTRVYASYTAQVFLKNNDRNKNIIERSKKGRLIFSPGQGPFYLEK